MIVFPWPEFEMIVFPWPEFEMIDLTPCQQYKDDYYGDYYYEDDYYGDDYYEDDYYGDDYYGDYYYGDDYYGDYYYEDDYYGDDYYGDDYYGDYFDEDYYQRDYFDEVYYGEDIENSALCPVYAPDGVTTNQANAIAYCQDICDKRVLNGEGCEGFFFEKWLDGHESCGFYTTDMGQGYRIMGKGVQAGAICDRETFKYEVAVVGDCGGSNLIESAEECQAAIKEVSGVENAVVQTWEQNDFPNGCFRHYNEWVFNRGGSGYLLDESGTSASICRAK